MPAHRPVRQGLYRISSIDRGGRYAFGQQPLVCRWNLYRLASALIEAIVAVDEADNEAARLLLERFPTRYEAYWIAGLRPKLGLGTAREGDLALGQDLFAALEGQGADFTRLFRALGASLEEGYGAIAAECTDPQALRPWWERWHERLARAYQDFVESDALTEKVFKVFHEVESQTFIPLASLGGQSPTPGGGD